MIFRSEHSMFALGNIGEPLELGQEADAELQHACLNSEESIIEMIDRHTAQNAEDSDVSATCS